MIKLSYKEKLSDDIEKANRNYDFIKNNLLMFSMDIVLGLTSVICGYKFGRENVNAFLLGLEVFGVSFSLTILKGLIEKRKIDNDRDISLSRLKKFSSYLRVNKINVTENDMKTAIVSSDKIVDHKGVVLDNAVSYQINSSDKKRLLVEMRESLAECISALRVEATLQEQEKFEDIQGEDVFLYLVEDYELSKKKK